MIVKHQQVHRRVWFWSENKKNTLVNNEISDWQGSQIAEQSLDIIVKHNGYHLANLYNALMN